MHHATGADAYDQKLILKLLSLAWSKSQRFQCTMIHAHLAIRVTNRSGTRVERRQKGLDKRCLGCNKGDGQRAKSTEPVERL